MLVDGNNFISHYLKNDIPLAAGKIGVTELNLLYCYYNLKNNDQFLPHLQHEVENIAGLYPYTEETTKKFTETFLSLLPEIDLIPIWNKVIPQFEDYILKTYALNSYKTTLEQLEPYFSDKPWTRYLKDKTVLVFSPFAESIEENYPNLEKIWNGKITNNFKLKVYKYPFSLPISNNKQYTTSEEVYNKYLQILQNESFDVGIFGTGYTSLLYTLYTKKLGKSAIHLGGSTQILFGIKGQRWKEIDRFASVFNEYWTEPKNTEKPEKLKLVEGGCYW
jgi:hypothetical protein